MNESRAPLKILHILDHSLPLHSGYTFRSQGIFRAQMARGWQPVVVTSPKHQQSWTGPCSLQEKIGGIQYYRSAAVSSNGFLLASELRLMSQLKQRIREVVAIEKPDLLHAHSPILDAFPALSVGRQMGLPVVYEIRAFWEDAAVDHGTYGQDSLKYNLVRRGETHVCRRSSQVAVLCRGLKDDLIGRGLPADKLTIVYNGIDPQDFKISAPDEELYKTWGLSGKKAIGFIGSFYQYEGLDLLVEAFHRSASHHPELTLLLVGGGEMTEALRAQIAGLGLQDRVILPGRIAHERIPGVYALVDILVCPRRSMRLTNLVTPLKPLEAMAMGKALVASDVGGHRELIQDGTTGILFPAGDAEALAAAIKRLLNDSHLRRQLGDQGRRWVLQEHTWEKTTAVYSTIYSQALGRPIP